MDISFNSAFNKVWDKVSDWVQEVILMLPNFAVAIVVFILFYMLGKILKNLSGKLLGKISNNFAINRLLTTIIFIAVVTVGFFIALGVLQLDKAVTSLLAGVGIIGLALGFAFQDIAANFMSGIAIAFRKPFVVNDIIEAEGYFGTVKKINLRTTDVLTTQGQMVLIPNKEVFQNPLINYSVTGERRIDLAVGISYGEDLERVKRITEDALKEIHNQIEEKPVEVFYNEFGDSSINFTARIWIKYNTNRDYNKAVSDAIIKIKKAYDENDIMIPFPIRTLDFGIKGGEKLSEMINGKVLSEKVSKKETKN